MAQENVEIVRRAHEVYERDGLSGDLSSVLDPEVEWVVHRTLGGELGFEPIYRGHAGVRDFFMEWFVAWEQVEFAYGRLIDVGERVVAPIHQTARGRSSGIVLTLDYALVYTFANGRISRMEMFQTQEEALEAAGLEE